MTYKFSYYSDEYFDQIEELILRSYGAGVRGLQEH